MEELGIFDGLLRGVYGARADDHNYPVVLAGEDACRVVAGRSNGES